MTPKDLLYKLAKDSMAYSMVFPYRKKPGQGILSLPEKEREMIKQITEKDVGDVRWPPYDCMRETEKKRS